MAPALSGSAPRSAGDLQRRADAPRGFSPAAAAARSSLPDCGAAASTRSCEDYRASGCRHLGWSRAEGRSGRGAAGSREREDRLGRRDRSPARSAGTGRAGRVALTMVRCGDAGVLLCALLGGLLLTGEARRGHRPGAGALGPASLGGNPSPGRSGHAWGRGAFPRWAVRMRASESCGVASGRPPGGRGRWSLLPGSGLGERLTPQTCFQRGRAWVRGSRNAGEAALGAGLSPDGGGVGR